MKLILSRSLAAIILSTMIAFMSVAFAQSYDWGGQMGGSGIDKCESMARDARGNLYLTGSFGGTVDFDPGSGVDTLSSVGSADIYMVKLDSSGNFIWAKQIQGSTGVDAGYAYDIISDQGQYLYLTGSFAGTVDFDPGSGTYYLTSTGAGEDAFICKMDTTGDIIWAQGLEGFDRVVGKDLDFFPGTGDLAVTGFFRSVVDFDPSSGFAEIDAGGNYDAFVCRYNPLGAYVWAKNIGGAGPAYGIGVEVDNSGNVYTTGYFEGIIDMDPSPGVISNVYSRGDRDAFLSKLDDGGNFAWGAGVGGGGRDVGYDVETDASGNVYLAGIFSDTVDFDLDLPIQNLTSYGNYDAFVLKVGGDAAFKWVKQFGGTSDDYAFDLAIDAAEDLYVSGIFSGTCDFDPGAGTMDFTSSGFDGYVAKLNNSGSLEWAKQVTGNDNEWLNKIVLGGVNSVYAAGHFKVDVDLDPDASIALFSSNGEEDIFVNHIYIAPPLATDAAQEMSKVMVYPNPATHSITISSEKQILYTEVVSLTGKVVMASSMESVLDLHNLPAGVYLLEIGTAEGVITRKFMKQ